MPQTDDWGDTAVVQPSPQSNDWGDTEVNIPKMPDTTWARMAASRNLAQPTSGNTQPSPQDRLNTAAGFPVSTALKGNDVEIPPSIRRQITQAYSNGTATSVGDYMQSILHSILPIVAGGVQHAMHPIDTAENIGEAAIESYKRPAAMMMYPFLSPKYKQIAEDSGLVSPPGGEPISPNASMAAKIIHGFSEGISPISAPMGAFYAPVSAPLAPVFNDVMQSANAGVPSQNASTIPDITNIAMTAAGGFGLHALGTVRPMGPWDRVQGADIIRTQVGNVLGKNPSEVTSSDIDKVIADGFKNHPTAQNFTDSATALGVNEKTLHVIWNETGVKDDQVVEDARNNPQIANDVNNDQIPESYQSLVPKPEIAPEQAEGLRIVRDDAAKSFTVVDKDGDYIQGGFNSNDEAQQFIEEHDEEPIGNQPKEWGKESRAGAPTEEKTQETTPEVTEPEEPPPPFIAKEVEAAKQKTPLEKISDFIREQGGQVASDFYRRIIGDTITAAEKFVGNIAGDAIEKFKQAYIKTFQPELMGDKALQIDAYLAKYKVALDEARNAFYRQSYDNMTAWDKRTTEEQLQWLYNQETENWADDEAGHARFRSLLDAAHKAEMDAIGKDAEEGYKQHYIPLQFDDPEGVQKFFSSNPAMIKKYGASWFTKGRAFDLLQDAVRAGFKLKNTNPEAILVSRLIAGHNLIATMDLLKDMENSGIATKATAFTFDKQIARMQAHIDELKGKYQAASDKINDPRQLRWDFADPTVNNYMKMVQERINAWQERLADITAQKEANKLTPSQMQELKGGGFRVIGPDNHVWNIHQEGAPVWRNAMEMKGLWERQGLTGDAYRAYMGGKAIWVRAKLAASLFHPIHEVDIHLATDLATIAEHLIKGGKFSDYAWDKSSLRMGLYGEGTRLKDNPHIVAWNTDPELRTSEQQTSVMRMIEGGYKPTISAQDAVKFKENWDKAISKLGPNNLRLIGAVLETPGAIMSPVFEHWIPSLKTDSYFQQTDLALKRDPSLANDPARRSIVFRRIAQNIERNYGEMNYSTQFWNPILRDVFNASFLSGGWKLAMLQNVRGLLEPAKIAYNFAKTGEFSKEQITHQMLQSYFYTAMILAQGAALTYLMTGAVGQMKDWLFPDTGDKNPDGTPIRLTQPAFTKEYFMLGRDINERGIVAGTGNFLYHQTLIPGIADTLNNQDYIGRTTISDPTDLHQWANAGWDFIKPITVSGIERAQEKESKTAEVMQFLGFPMAGAWVNQTPFEQKVLYEYDKFNPPKDTQYQSVLKNELRNAVSSGKPTDAIEDKMKQEGVSTDRINKLKYIYTQIHEGNSRYTQPFVKHAWEELPPEIQNQLLPSASDEEKETFKIKGE